MKTNKEIFKIILQDAADPIDSNTYYCGDMALEAMKKAQVEVIKEIVKRFRSQGNPFFDKKFKTIEQITLELIKEIES